MAEIKRTFKCNCKEISIDLNGCSYLAIYGKHINGGYCAFPKLGIAAELSDSNDAIGHVYNRKKLLLEFSKNSSCSEIDKDSITALSKVITEGIQELPDVLPF